MFWNVVIKAAYLIKNTVKSRYIIITIENNSFDALYFCGNL